MSTDVMLNAALDLARNGWSVFPCWEKTYSDKRKAKAPVGHLAPNGLLDASNTPETIVSWWTSHPTAIIGARVPDQLMVIDIDPRHHGDSTLASLESHHGALPATLTTRSGRNDGGTHRWFYRCPGKLRGKNLGAGIDLKTSTGYVIVPPSLHPKRVRVGEIGADRREAAPRRFGLHRRLLLPTATGRAAGEQKNHKGNGGQLHARQPMSTLRSAARERLTRQGSYFVNATMETATAAIAASALTAVRTAST